MDGTLLDADHVTIPARNIAALRAARERGVKIAIASGRTWSMIGSAMEQLGGLDYAILSNGGAIREAESGTCLWEKPIPNAQALKIIDIFQAENIIFEVYCQGQNYVAAAQREIIRQHNLSPAFSDFFDRITKFPEDLPQGLAGRDVEKFNVLYVPPEDRSRIQAAIAATGEPVQESNAFRDNMELSANGANKGAALAALAERLGLAPDEVMAFGDAGNDLEMLSWAGWSFAMENGSDAAKAAAKHLTAANTEAGVGQAIEKYVLGQ
jgi:hypothetical protein